MKFTEEDIPLMKLIFNPSTHDMGVMLGKNTWEKIYDVIDDTWDYWYETDISFLYSIILCKKEICDFVWDNRILNLSLIQNNDYYYIFLCSPIAKKIFDSKRCDLTKFNGFSIHRLVFSSPIAKQVWNSKNIDKSNFSIMEKIFFNIFFFSFKYY